MGSGIETSSPPGRGDKASPVLSWACLFPVESPWKLSESPLSPQEGDQGLGRISPWASHAQHHTQPL